MRWYKTLKFIWQAIAQSLLGFVRIEAGDYDT